MKKIALRIGIAPNALHMRMKREVCISPRVGGGCTFYAPTHYAENVRHSVSRLGVQTNRCVRQSLFASCDWPLALAVIHELLLADVPFFFEHDLGLGWSNTLMKFEYLRGEEAQL